jgi:cytochrome c oxidase subunit II
MSRRRAITVLTAAAAAALILGMPGPSSGRADEPKSIDVVAKRFEFTPSSITVARDEAVELRLTTEDVRHGFFSRDLELDSEFLPGKTTAVRFTPHKAGSYTVICDRFCGAGHGNMKLTVVVP